MRAESGIAAVQRVRSGFGTVLSLCVFAPTLTLMLYNY